MAKTHGATLAVNSLERTVHLFAAIEIKRADPDIFANEFVRFVTALDLVLELLAKAGPTPWTVGFDLLVEGSYDAAKPRFELILEHHPDDLRALYYLACIHSRLAGPVPSLPSSAPHLSLCLDEPHEQKAIEYLNRAVTAGFSDVELLESDPAFDSIRDRAMFSELLAALVRLQTQLPQPRPPRCPMCPKNTQSQRRHRPREQRLSESSSSQNPQLQQQQQPGRRVDDLSARIELAERDPQELADANSILGLFGEAMCIPDLRFDEDNECWLDVEGLQRVSLVADGTRIVVTYAHDISPLCTDESVMQLLVADMCAANFGWWATRGCTLSLNEAGDSVCLSFSFAVKLGWECFRSRFKRFLQAADTWHERIDRHLSGVSVDFPGKASDTNVG